jgi:CHAT domain-containing protein/tetratricopeptide (TPR) repeat protein
VAALAVVALAASLATALGRQRADVRPFPSGEIVEREMSDQEQHFYVLTLKRGEAIQVDLTEKGVNCVVMVIDDIGPKPLNAVAVDFGTGNGRETVTYVAPRAGEYVVGVGVGVHTGAPPGRYIMAAQLIPTPSPGQRSRGEAVRLFNEGLAILNEAHDAKSLQAVAVKVRDALSLWKGLKEDYWTAAAAFRLGNVLADLDQKAKAVENFELARELFHKVGDKPGQSDAASNLGAVYAEFGEHSKSLKFFSEALALTEEIGDQKERASLLISLGALNSAMGSQREALEHYEKALRILKVAPDGDEESRALSGLARLYVNSGETAKALSNLNRALELAKQSKHADAKPKLLSDVGVVYSKLGEPRRALDYMRQALSLREHDGNRRGQANVSSNIGQIYFDLGEFGEARNYFLHALSIYEEMGDDVEAARMSLNLGGVYKLVGDSKGWERNLLHAIALLKGKESENRALYSGILLQAGDMLGVVGDKDSAIKAYQGVIDMSRDIGNKTNEALALVSLADLYFYTGDSKKGAETNSQAYLAAVTSEDQDIEAWALGGLMACWRSAGNTDLAVFYGKLSLNKKQELRTHIRGLDSETQKSYVRRHGESYAFLASALLGRGRYAEALQIIKSTQDQQSYDFSRDGAAPARPIDLTPREAAFASTLRRVTDQVVAAARQLEEFKRPAEGQPPRDGAGQLARLEAESKAASEEFAAALERAAADFSKPPREGENLSRATDLSDLQSILGELSALTGRQTVALYPFASPMEFRVLLVTPDSAFTAASPLPNVDFDQKVMQFYALLQTPALDPRPLGKELYDLVVKPLEPALRAAGAQTLLWSLGGTLRYVPMASLWDGQRYLVERFRNVVFTRADRERMTRAVSPAWTGVGFGTSRAHAVDLFGNGNRVPLPALPGVSEEMPAIFRPAGRDGVVKGEVFLDGEFTRVAFLGLAKRRPALVHVASHFSFRPGDDRQSFLLLGDGTTLTLNEIKRQGRLFEGVELLTLSACETAATRPDAMGREIDGFAESAQRLGAAAVIATLWTVADNSTSRLMREFYRARQGVPLLTKAEALRRAQLSLLHGMPGGAPTRAVPASAPASFKVELVNAPGGGKGAAAGQTGRVRGAGIIYVDKSQAPAFKTDPDRPFAHPFYWSPFVLIGNGN